MGPFQGGSARIKTLADPAALQCLQLLVTDIT